MPGIRDAAYLEDVVKQTVQDSCTVIVLDMRTSTLDFSNLWPFRLALRLISGMSRTVGPYGHFRDIGVF